MTCNNCVLSNNGLPNAECIVDGCKFLPKKTKTNADYIRNMTDDELANLLEDVRTHGFTDLCCNDSLCDSDGCDCCMADWLKAERECAE